MTELKELCSVGDVTQGEPLRVEPDGFPALAVYCVDGAYYVTDDTCTHAMASLADGCQDGEEIECPYHGGAFNIKSGEPTSLPCTAPLKVYVVTERDGALCVRSSGK